MGDLLKTLNPAGLFSGITSLAGGIASLKNSRRMFNESMKFQREAMDRSEALQRETNAQNYNIFNEGNAFNERMMRMQMDYNSAAAQRKRLEDAGLNPFLMMGQGGQLGSSASSGGQGNAISPGSLFGTFSGSMSESASRAAEQQNLATSRTVDSLGSVFSTFYSPQARSFESDANYNSARTDTENLTRGAQLQEMIERTNLAIAQAANEDQKRYLSRVQESQLRVYGMYQDDILRSEINQRNADAEKSRQQALQSMADAAYTYAKTQTWPAEVQSQLSLAAAQIYELSSRSGLNQAQAMKATQEKLESQARTYGIDLSNEQADALMWSVVNSEIARLSYNREMYDMGYSPYGYSSSSYGAGLGFSGNWGNSTSDGSGFETTKSTSYIEANAASSLKGAFNFGKRLIGPKRTRTWSTGGFNGYSLFNGANAFGNYSRSGSNDIWRSRSDNDANGRSRYWRDVNYWSRKKR